MSTRGFPPVTLPRSELRCFAVESRAGCGAGGGAGSTADGGDEWAVFIAWPEEPPPPAGYPVVYLVDANATFATLVESIRMRARRASSTGVAPAVVVGIGYPAHVPHDRERRAYDLTSAPPSPSMLDTETSRYAGEPPRPSKASSFGRTGGAARLRAFLARELIPAVERDFPVDAARRSLVGHSLAGLFVLETLFADPRSFAAYVAISPSVWWDRERLLTGADAVAASGVAADVLLSVGEYEREPAPWQLGGDPAALAGLRRRRAQRRMVETTRELARRLAAAPEGRMRVRYDVLAGEDHASVVPVALGRALRVVLAPR